MEIKKELYQRFRDKSKKILFQEVSRRIKTTMIGSIAVLEQHFEKDDPAFAEIRKNILDLGNNQIRCLEQTLEHFDIEYHNSAILLPQKENRE